MNESKEPTISKKLLIFVNVFALALAAGASYAVFKAVWKTSFEWVFWTFVGVVIVTASVYFITHKKDFK